MLQRYSNYICHIYNNLYHGIAVEFCKVIDFKVNSIYKGERKIPTYINWSSKLPVSANQDKKIHIQHIICGPEKKEFLVNYHGCSSSKYSYVKVYMIIFLFQICLQIFNTLLCLHLSSKKSSNSNKIFRLIYHLLYLDIAGILQSMQHQFQAVR